MHRRGNPLFAEMYNQDRLRWKRIHKKRIRQDGGLRRAAEWEGEFPKWRKKRKQAVR